MISDRKAEKEREDTDYYDNSGSRQKQDVLILVYIAVFAVVIGSLLMDFHSGTGTVYSADIWSIYGSWCAWRKRGTLAVLVYVLLGAVGVPVFAGFSGGIGALLGNAGGYIIGFIFSALVMWAIEHVFGRKPVVQIISMIVGLIVCYALNAWLCSSASRLHYMTAEE